MAASHPTSAFDSFENFFRRSLRDISKPFLLRVRLIFFMTKSFEAKVQNCVRDDCSPAAELELAEGERG